MTTPMVYAAILKAGSLIPAIGKNQKNAAQGWKFRGIDDVQNLLGEPLRQAKLAVLPNYEYISEETAPGGKGFRVVVRGTYTLVCSEDSSSCTVSYLAEAIDFGDKASSKALSMCYKYFAFQTFIIPVVGGVLDDGDKDVVEVDTSSFKSKYFAKKG